MGKTNGMKTEKLNLEQLLSGARGCLGILSLLFFTVTVVTLAANDAVAQSVDEGKRIFEEWCAACHSIGEGILGGPDLEGVTRTREKAWLRRFIAKPDEMIAGKDPIAMELLAEFNDFPMPNLDLTDEEVAAVIAYLESKDGATPEEETPPEGREPVPSAPLVAGDPEAGRSLFTGSTAFENGGSPCMACHSAGRLVQLGGGSVGPDLTHVFSKFGESGMVPLLASLPFPTMKPIYGERPLTAQEQMDVKAFFKAVDEEEPASAGGRFGILAFVGLGVMAILFQVVWRRRLSGVRAPLVEEHSKGKQEAK